MLRGLAFLLILSGLSAPGSAGEKEQPPASYVDKGACPGEGCAYGGRWRVLKDTVLYADPREKSKPVGKCLTGTEVLAETGEVHTVAGQFTVKKAYEKFKPGDTLWVYTYLGEGSFKVWRNGSFEIMDLGFSPWGGTSGARCEAKDCWGELKERLQFTWWVRVRTPDGAGGWTRETDHFDTNNESAAATHLEARPRRAR